MADDRRDGGDRPRGRGGRGGYRGGRGGGGGRGRDHAPRDRDDRRNRSRSPRDHGDRRGGYRNRSPFSRGDDRDRGARNDRDQDRDPRDFRSRGPPTGPRNAPSGPKSSFTSHAQAQSQSRSGPPTGPRAATSPGVDKDVNMEEPPQRQRPEGMDDETWEMAQVMGFARFKSTKNTKVPGNDKNYGVRREKKMEARQYMNRQGGFNRPLSPSRG